MDFSKFLDDNFDVKDWVNEAFKSPEAESNKDGYAASLVMKLQLFIQEVNNSLEDSSQQVLHTIPSILRDIEAVKQEALLLQEQMRLVKEDIKKVEQDTAQSMQVLLNIDAVKCRMQTASQALQEVDNWTNLSSDVEKVFESQDVHAISEKLVRLQQSLNILVDVPDYKERCQHLEELKNRLEAMLSPQLVTTFNTLALDAAQMYVKIFTDIDRLAELQKYYHKCQKTHLLRQWQIFLENDPDETVLDWMNNYYDFLLSTWHSQVKWCNQVFLDPLPLVCNLISDVLTSLDPSLNFCIEAAIKTQFHPLSLLIDLKQITDRFAKSIELAIDSNSLGKLTDPYVVSIAKTIYCIYCAHVQKYGDYEERLLLNELTSIQLESEETMESVRYMSESVSRIFSFANSANDRCKQFTNGCGYVGLIKALQIYFRHYIDKFRQTLSLIKEKNKLDNSTEDWTLFQHALRITQTCGELLLHLEEFEEILEQSIRSIVGKFCPLMASPVAHVTFSAKQQQAKNPFQDFHMFLLTNGGDRTALQNILSKVQGVGSESVGIMSEITLQFHKLSRDVTKFAFDVVFSQIKIYLDDVPNMEVWRVNTTGGVLTMDLPTFSLSPQEYITKIGQYLMTLPQQIEPFVMQENPALRLALKFGKMPFSDDKDKENADHLADYWLGSVAKALMHTYVEAILRIPELSPYATKQLITDLDYLRNVLEDLGLQILDSLQNITTLLKTPPDQFSEMAQNMPQRLASILSSMRCLQLS